MATVVTAGVHANDKGGNWKCGGRGDEGSGAVEGASRVIYGRDLFSSGCVSDKRFEIVW